MGALGVGSSGGRVLRPGKPAVMEGEVTPACWLGDRWTGACCRIGDRPRPGTLGEDTQSVWLDLQSLGRGQLMYVAGDDLERVE